MVKGVSGLMSHDVTDKRHAEQGKVTNTVEHLVADKLVFVPESFVIQYAFLVQHHGVFQGTTSGKSVLLQIIDLMQESKGSGPADFLCKKTVSQRNAI